MNKIHREVTCKVNEWKGKVEKEAWFQRWVEVERPVGVIKGSGGHAAGSFRSIKALVIYKETGRASLVSPEDICFVLTPKKRS